MFDEETFGQTIKPEPQKKALSSNHQQFSSSFIASTVASEVHSSSSWDQIKNEQSNQDINKQKKSNLKCQSQKYENKFTTTILHKMNIRSISTNDNFYCSCGQHQGKERQCMVCRGKGGVDGSNNLVKFIEYVMQFKLAMKQCYIPATKPKQFVKNEKETKSKLSKCSPSHLKEKIEASSNKAILKLNNLRSKVNSFCLDFFKRDEEPQRENNVNLACKSQIFDEGKKDLLSENPNLSNQTSYESQNFNTSQINLGMGSMAESVADFQTRKSIQNHNAPINHLNENTSGNTFSQIDFNEIIHEKEEGSSGQEKEESQSYDYCKRNQMASMNQDISKQSCSNFTNMNSKSMLVGTVNQQFCNRKSMSSICSMSMAEFKQKIKDQCSVHGGFGCDQCDMNPIVGTRYHCTSRECSNDFDLCEKCYEYTGHIHQMQVIRFNKLNNVFQKVQKISKQAKSIQSKINSKMNYGSNFGNRSSIGGGPSNYSRMSIENPCKEEEEEDEKHIPVFKSSIH